jgi:peptidoglycan/xylan/chitin deacetylase (PgdA/CDA1 family)
LLPKTAIDFFSPNNDNRLDKGILIISLDFELHWGRFDKYPLSGYEGYYTQTREVIPRLLELFVQNNIRVTWATVGSLMADDVDEWRHYSPNEFPSYQNDKLSGYTWVNKQRFLMNEALFAPNLVRQIIDSPGQELGSHTYSHYYTCEKGQNHEQFRMDLKAAVRIAQEKFGKSLKSLVFPRNQYDELSVQIAGEEGFETVRSNPSDWFWQHTEEQTLVKRIFRTGDTLIPLGKQSSYPIDSVNTFLPVRLPASRLLRPYKGDFILHRRRISRIKEEMEVAARSGHIYHLWWHPHNFGFFSEENLEGLRQILIWLKVLELKYGMRSMHMQDTASEILIKAE